MSDWKLPCPIRGVRHQWLTVGISQKARHRRCQECDASRIEPRAMGASQTDPQARSLPNPEAGPDA